jgi:HKD family nuclease
MPENNTAQNLNLNTDDTIIETTDVMTGDRNMQRYLYYQLVGSLKKAQSVDIIVSFLMESGVKLLLKDLDSARIIKLFEGLPIFLRVRFEGLA